MRILYLCHRIPYPPDKGDKIRAFHQLRALAGAGHELDLFALADDPGDLAHRESLATYCRRVEVARVNPRWARIKSLPYLVTATPLTIPYFYSAELKRHVDAALDQRPRYDRILVYCSAIAQYAPLDGSIPMVIDLVDVDSDKWTQYAAFTKFPLSAIYRREGRALAAYEQTLCERASCVVVSTEREAHLARRIAPRAHIEVVVNGVDTEFFQPSAQAPKQPTVIFTGDMSYFPNQEAVIYFARQVLPLIQLKVPDARFLIVGRNPGRKVRRLCEIKGVEITGFVADVREWLGQAQVAVAPFTIAAGIQNKILEAMASGLPVVVTPRAAQGLSPGVAALVEKGNSPEELAAKVVVLLLDPNHARRRGMDGRRQVAEDYSWERALAQLKQLVEAPVERGFSKS